MASETSPTVLQWIVDTKKLWLVNGQDGKTADLKVRVCSLLLYAIRYPFAEIIVSRLSRH